MTARVLLVAKAPVPGRVKTRLGAGVGLDLAAELAAAALLDTLAACVDAVGPARCHLSLDGDLDEALEAEAIRRLLGGWSVTPQRGDGFGERLAHAHADCGPGPIVQIGMDTPQVGPGHLLDVAAALTAYDGVLGPAEDGGWWVLGLRDPLAADALRGVAMSTPSTYADTRAALTGRGLRVADAVTLRDVDTAGDAGVVAAEAPHTLFARRWQAVAAR
ncbi:unannotated protein [freshwater metagenome]|uniref:Unannotated protein n=1 Tax=freshwater metagenome TaxID=449393 RepID=A0A6J6S0G7_9ZZZZ